MIINNDCLIALKELPENSIDAIVTDPPYGLSFMGKKWDYDVPSTELWAECLRVLKPGGYLLAFAGTRTQHRMAVRIEDAGFEIRDMIAWIYGSGFPKSLNVGVAVNKLETKEWSAIGKALDNIDKKNIIEVWKSNSNNVKIVETQSLKLKEKAGCNTPSENFVQENVVENTNQIKLSLNVNTAEKHFIVLQAIHTEESTVLQNAEKIITEISELQNLVTTAENSQQSDNAMQSMNIFTAQCDVKEWLNENTEVNHKVDEALKILRGNKKYSNEEITNVLCAVLPSVLKLTILNQSKTFQNLDTTQKTECVSAINVIITEYTAENLISNTVDILKGKAVDKLQGNEREDLGVKTSASYPDSDGVAHYKNRKQSEGSQVATGGMPKITKGTSEWEGWGTALKPAVEPVSVCSKPLQVEHIFVILIDDIWKQLNVLGVTNNLQDTQVKLNEVVNSVHENARTSVLESTNNAELVKQVIMSLQTKSEEEKENSVLENVAQNGEKLYQEIKTQLGEEVEANLMDISISAQMGDISENTALLWKNISEEILNQANKLTTRTALKLITDLKTLRLFLLQNTFSNTGLSKKIQPNLEPITVARKPIEGTVAENCLKWGVGGINIDGSRVEMSPEDKEMLDAKASTNNNGVNFDVGEGKAKGTATPANNLGRFPANLILEDCEEVRECFPDAGKGNGRGAYNYAGREYDNKDTSMFNGDKPQAPSNFNDSGNASRFFKSIIYQAKASKSERNMGLEGFEEQIGIGNYMAEAKWINDPRHKDGGYMSAPSKPQSNFHPTVKPIKLMEYLVNLVSKPGHTVLDPFAGSGTTGIACKKLNRNFIGIERDEEYCKIAEARINAI